MLGSDDARTEPLIGQELVHEGIPEMSLACLKAAMISSFTCSGSTPEGYDTRDLYFGHEKWKPIC